MKLKMKQILSFSNFYITVKSQKLPMKTAYNLARLVKNIETKQQFYHEKLQEII